MSRPDPLAALLRLRQATLDEMQQCVGRAYAAERDAGALVEAAGRALEQEGQTALNLSAGDETVETYARWLPIGRRALQRAHDEQRAATAELDRARALLSLARADVRAVETELETRRKRDMERRNRCDRNAADEAARVLFVRRTTANR